MARLFSKGSAKSRFESDAEVLHFPKGGVFALPSEKAHTNRMTCSDISVEIERALSIAQGHMDRLRNEVDDALRLPLADTWPPRAA